MKPRQLLCGNVFICTVEGSKALCRAFLAGNIASDSLRSCPCMSRSFPDICGLEKEEKG